MERKNAFLNAVRIFPLVIFAQVLGAVVAFSLGAISTSPAFSFITQAFTLMIYIVILYAPVWNIGDRDQGYYKMGKLKEDLLFGLKIGLFVSIPYFISWGLLLISKMGIIPDFGVVYRLINFHIGIIINAVLGVKAISDISYTRIIIAGLFNFLPVIVCTVTYILGFKRIDLLGMVVYKKKKR